jgi:chlorophyll(ide) b reductase
MMLIQQLFVLVLAIGNVLRVQSLIPLGATFRHTTAQRNRVSLHRDGISMQAMPDGGIVITGGANGVGFAYAGEFMDRGYDVVICDVKDCTAAATALTNRHPNGKIYHIKCDVSNYSDVEKLGQFAVKNLNRIGYWINNAGINGGRRDFRDVPVNQVEAVVKVNLLGILLCTKVAMSIMEQQEDFTGHIFNTVGSGVKGGGTPGYACYGATKRGLPQLTASLGE